MTNLRTHASRSIRPSSNLRMPHVFVVPPEEEQLDNPPWCCFDADEQPENNGDFPSNPNIHFLDVPYLLKQSEQDIPPPIARRISVHQPRPRVHISKKLEKKQRPEAIKIIENKPSQARRDSDVIEVVKVKRSREALADLEENTKAKRSKTLKARATKALQSIKNVGKGSHRTHVKELWTSSESMPGIFKGMHEQIRSQQDQTEQRPPASPTEKGPLSRNNSRSLSQVFQPAKPSRPESSFTVRVASSVALAEAHHIPPAENQSSLPHLRYNNTNPSLNEVPNTLTIDDALNRPVSRSPPLKKNTKFSVRELHRLFSFSSLSPDDPSSAPTAAMAPCSSTHSSSMPSTSTSTLSSNYPDVPMEEKLFADAHFPDLGSADQKLVSRYRQAVHTHHGDNLSTLRRLSDLSFEMRLDSLHFDALSFDPEDFDVSMEGNILR